MLNVSLLVAAPALALDALVGDPGSRWHPVAIFGAAMEAGFRRAPKGNASQLAFGLAMVLAAVTTVGVGSAWLLAAAGAASSMVAVIIGALLLKVSFAYRQLRSEALRVATALEREELEGARAHLGALVSRDASMLTPPLAASAAVESLAENLCDSLVAPFFYYVLLGVPGALAYRAINTLDAMVGYRGAFEYLGKAAAKMDDWANWVPARLTALLLVGGALLAGAEARNAARVAVRDHGTTESPNAGWPMSAMAGALRVELKKVGHYRLGDPEAELAPGTIRRAVRVADFGAALACALLLVVALL